MIRKHEIKQNKLTKGVRKYASGQFLLNRRCLEILAISIRKKNISKTAVIWVEKTP